MESKVRVFQLAVMWGVIAVIYAQAWDFGALLYFDDRLYFVGRALVDDWWGAPWSDRLLTPDVGYPNPGPTAIYAAVRSLPADLILPAAAWVEEQGLFVNTEGRPQLALRAGFAPGQAKENWAILRALSAELDATQPWNSLAQLRRALVEAHPHLARIDEVAENEWQPLELGSASRQLVLT